MFYEAPGSIWKSHLIKADFNIHIPFSEYNKKWKHAYIFFLYKEAFLFGYQ